MNATINAQLVEVELIPSADALKPEALQPETLKPETLKPDALKPDALQPETLKPDALTPRELWALETLDNSLRAFPDFAAKYPDAKLVRVDSMRLLLESTSGRYYLRYSSDAGMTEFWGHVSRQSRLDLKRGIISITNVPSTISSIAATV